MTPLETVLETVEGARKSGNGWSAKCPAHEDRNPSLSITPGADGKVLLFCHAGCDFASIVKGLGLEEGDLFPPKDREGRRVVAEYSYVDETGADLFQAVRFEPKDFRQRHREPNGAWSWNLNGTRRVLYRLPELVEGVKAGATVFVVEGEKDVEALRSLGLVATCNPMGAGKWRDDYAAWLRGACVVVIADKDEPGRKHAAVVEASLRGKAAAVRVVEVPEGKDAADWIAKGATRADFEKLCPAPERRVVRKSLVDVIRGIRRRNPLPLGLPHLDAMLGGGLSAGDSLVVGGGPGTLKTTTLATVIKSMAGPKTAITGVFFDEHHERVCRKIAVRFGLQYAETEESTEEVLARLQDELRRRDALLEIITPETDPTVEEIVEDAIAWTPEGRVPVLIVDHLHRLRSAATADRDNPSASVGNVVNAVLRATSRGAIVYALSEVTKAATSPDFVRANPQGVFADSRAILSRFDVGFATVRLPPPSGSQEILAEVICAWKNRFGPGYGGYVSSLDLSSWKVTTRDSETFAAEAEERKAAAQGKERTERMAADDALVLSYIAGHAVSQEIGCRARDVEEGLPAESGGAIGQKRVRASLIRMRDMSRVEEHPWKPAGKSGPEAKYVRIRPEKDDE